VWNKGNGFFLVDTMLAVCVCILFLLPILLLSKETMRTYDQALSWQQAAMIAREMMEEHRQAGDVSMTTEVKRQGRTYRVEVDTYPVDAYRCYVVVVEDVYGRVFQCKRLEKA